MRQGNDQKEQPVQGWRLGQAWEPRMPLGAGPLPWEPSKVVEQGKQSRFVSGIL